MTIQEYYDNYIKNKKADIKLPKGGAKTIEDFYNKCLVVQQLPKENVLKWHKMFMEYVNKPDAIFWVRYYESGKKEECGWNTRRGCKTQFADSFSYVFVSNYDAHEIFNMVRLGVEPNVQEFLNLMKDHTFPLHRDRGGSCEEKDIAIYEKTIGSTRAGILTPEHWYLAHITGIKSTYYNKSGEIVNVDVEKIYPRGDKSDWLKNNKTRKLNYSLSEEQKNIVKAHFLRFVDPLNYYAAPGKNYQTSDAGCIIGEVPAVNDFMTCKYAELYGEENIKEYRRIIMAGINFPKVNKSTVVNVKFGLKNNDIALKHSSKKEKNKIKYDVNIKLAGKTINLMEKTAKDVIIDYILPILQNEKFPQEEIKSLKLGLNFGVKYPFISYEREEDAGGKHRYYAKKYCIKGEEFYICSEIVRKEKNFSLLAKWIEKYKKYYIAPTVED